MHHQYGKLQEKDLPLLESVVEVFKRHGFNAGLHGTSLWNPNYKDIDLLIVGKDTAAFRKALVEATMKCKGQIDNLKGSTEIGLDCDLKTPHAIIHISYVLFI